MLARITSSDARWAYSAQVLNIGGWLLLLPFALRHLPQDQIGLWFVFLTIVGLVQLIEGGIQPTLTRNFAYVHAGAADLVRVGLPSLAGSRGDGPNVELLGRLTQATRRLYRMLAAAALIFLWLAGSAYVASLLPPGQDPRILLGSWLGFSGGVLLTLYFGYLTPILLGRGDIRRANQVVVLTRGSMVLLGMLGLSLGGGLPSLALAALLSAGLGRLLAARYARQGSSGIENAATPLDDRGCVRDLMQTLWHNASRQAIVQVGAFAVQRGGILIASSFLGVAAAASFSLSLLLLLSLFSLSTVHLQAHMPRMAALQLQGDRAALRRAYLKVLSIGLILFGTGAVAIISWGPDAMALLGSSTELVSPSILAALSLVLALELNHSIAASFITTRNTVPFVASALASGGLTLGGGVVLVGALGLWGLVLAQGVVQLAYNNWKWPLEVIRLLRHVERTT